MCKKICVYMISFAFFLAASFAFAEAETTVQIAPKLNDGPSFVPAAPNLAASSYILLDAKTNKILAEKNADVRLPPASLTKLMSMYIISQALKNNQIKLDDKVRISQKAWKTEGSRMFVKVNEEVPVKELLEGVIVASGNDATVALAEHIAGTEDAFVSLMNQQANILGMKNSHFVDSTGLPNKDHYSTAHDLAILSQAYIKNFPEDYKYYSEKWFSYNHIKQPNRNRLLWRYAPADGLKTGHTHEAGYCLVASAQKNGMRLISVVLGEPTDLGRTEDSIRLLTYGFRFYETHLLYPNGKNLAQARIWKGVKATIDSGVQKDLYITIPTGQYSRLKAKLEIASPLEAPVKKGDKIGEIKVVLNDQVIANEDLVALENDKKGGFFRRTGDSIRFHVNKFFSKNADDEINTG